MWESTMIADGNKTFERIGQDKLRDQISYTANALRNLARQMESSGRDVPARFIRAVDGHAVDLERAAGVLK